MANDGTVVQFSRSSRSIALWNGREVRGLSTSEPVWSAIISALGNVVIYESFPWGGQARLLSINLATKSETQLFMEPAAKELQASFLSSVSDDGRIVLAVPPEIPGRPGQWLATIATDASNPNWLAYAPEGYREAVLSGNGRTAFAVTMANRLVRVDLESGAVAELIPATGWIDRLEGAFAPGSANHVLGGGFSAGTVIPEVFPAPTSLGAVQVEYAGTPMPLVKVAPNEIVLQIPWEMSIPDCGPQPDFAPIPVRVLTTQSGPFEDAELQIVPCRGQALLEGPILHEDGTPVSVAAPIRADEVLFQFSTGLGPVDPPVETGMPAPEDPPARLVQPFQCFVRGQVDRVPAEVLFAGLAPGRIGVYQIKVRTPSSLPDAPLPEYLQLVCEPAK